MVKEKKIELETTVKLLSIRHRNLKNKIDFWKTFSKILFIMISISLISLGFLFGGYQKLSNKLDGYEDVCINWEPIEKHDIIEPISNSILCIENVHFGCESGFCSIENRYKYCIPSKFEGGLVIEYNYSNEPIKPYIYTYEKMICNETILKKFD